MKRYTIFSILFVLLVSGCGTDTDSTFTTRLTFDFFESPQGWTGEFAELPPDSRENFDLEVDFLPLPEPLDTTQNALFISGVNLSDDLFMFFKQQFTGLSSGQEVKIRYQIRIATNVPQNCVGAGGAPGESVFLKAGTSVIEPLPVLEEGNREILRLNVDKGNQSQGGENAVILGNIANSRDCSDENADEWEFKDLQMAEEDAIEVTADENGRIWFFFGTDSGFEGRTSIYYSLINIFVESV